MYGLLEWFKHVYVTMYVDRQRISKSYHQLSSVVLYECNTKILIFTRIYNYPSGTACRSYVAVTSQMVTLVTAT